MNTSPAKNLTAELTTAMLIPVDSPGKPTINFLFNPDLTLNRTQVLTTLGQVGPKLAFLERKLPLLTCKTFSLIPMRMEEM
jgi:hypothetical protein